MILDPESFALANAIDVVLEECGDPEHVKPELLESVLEISTPPAHDTREAGEQLRALRAQGAAARRSGAACASARRARTRSRCGRTSASSAQERYRELVSALRFVARQEIIFGLHVHVGIDDAEKAIHVANGMRTHVPCCWRCRPTRRSGARRRPAWRLADADLPRVPARRGAAGLRRVGRLRGADRLHDGGRDDRGLHLDVVRRPAAPELRHGRDPGDGRPDARGAHARAGRADPGDGARARPRTSRPASEVAHPPDERARREPLAGRSPRARRRAGRPP